MLVFHDRLQAYGAEWTPPWGNMDTMRLLRISYIIYTYKVISLQNNYYG